MAEMRRPSRGALSWRAVLFSAMVAGTVATLVQLLFWWVFWDVLPGILYRDARLTAAIVLGRGVLPPPATFDAKVFVVATFIHFALSFVYCVVLAILVGRRSRGRASAIGAGFGALLFVVNMYGFTLVFPWFAVARDWITLSSHMVFGMTAAVCYQRLSRSL